LREIEAFEPDIVHLHNIHGYYVDAYRLLGYLKNKRMPTVITMHDEWLYTGKCGYAYSCKRWQASCGNCPQLSEYPKSLFLDRSAKELALKREAFGGFENLIFAPVSAWLMGQAKQSPFLSDKRFTVAHNGIDLDIFRPRDTGGLRERHGLKDEKIIVHVTPDFDDPRKGGRFVLDLARRLKGENVKLIAVGIKKPIEDCPESLIAIGRTENQAQLAEYYSLGDIFLITSEMECLPTVCLEALCCGTPVLGFEAGGTSETAPAPYGAFVPHGDMERLEEAARDILAGESKLASPEECAAFGQREYGRSGMTERYLEIYDALMSNGVDA
jgi:glycosyltransferase involved in cell wall biosynthesis